MSLFVCVCVCVSSVALCSGQNIKKVYVWCDGVMYFLYLIFLRFCRCWYSIVFCNAICKSVGIRESKLIYFEFGSVKQAHESPVSLVRLNK